MGIKVGKLNVKPLPDDGSDSMWHVPALEESSSTDMPMEQPPVPTEPEPEEASQRLGKFRLGAILGQGGMGRVYAAFDLVLQREVALKVLWRSDPSLYVRFLREAQYQARLDHPNICKVYEVLMEEATPCIAMQLVHGRGLLDTELEMETEQVLDVMVQCAEAVHAAHQAGMIHRDLKPGNILLEPDGRGGWKPVLLDFGLARDLEGPSITMGSGLMGTPAYMAPEQAKGQGATVASDVYSLGATFYAFLAGRSAFRAASAAELLFKQSRRQAIPIRRRNPQVPRGLEAILQKCMELEPSRRYADCAALAQDLRRLQAGGEPRARRNGLLRRTWRNRASRLALGAALLLGVTCVGILSTCRPTHPPLAGRRGTFDRPIRILLVSSPRRDDLHSWVEAGLQATLADALRCRTDVLAFETGSLTAAAQEGTAALVDLARSRGADLVLEARVASEGGRHRLQVLAMVPGEARRTLLQRTFETEGYMGVEGELATHLDDHLGLPDQGGIPWMPCRLDARRTYLQAYLIAYAESNSESDRTALGLLRRVVAEEPGYAPAYILMGKVQNDLANAAVHQGQGAEALRLLDQARAASERGIELAPGHPGGYLNLCFTYRLQGDFEALERTALQAQKLEPLGTESHLQLAMLNLQRPGTEAHEAALRHARLAVRLRPDDPYCTYRLAHVHFDAGQFRTALAEAERTLQLMPGMEYAHILRTNALLFMGDQAGLEAALRQGTTQLPNAPLLKRNQVLAAFQRRDATLLRERLDRCRNLWPPDSPTRALLDGVDAASQGRWPAAQALFERALADLKARPAVLNTMRASASMDLYLMARILAQGPRPQAALPFLRQAQAFYPNRMRMAAFDATLRTLAPVPEPWPEDDPPRLP